jgi:multisubunit Na+/H+ antiporter MnhB subunit
MSTASRRSEKLEWRGPAIAWGIMLVALVCLVLLGVYSSGGLRFGGALALAAVMLMTLAFGLVGVATEPPLMRLVAGAAFMFLALMFFLSFTDLLTRIRYHS